MDTTSNRAEEIRKQSVKWSLQGDSQLLEYMKVISEKLENLTRDTDQRINRMCLNGQKVNVELGNVTNRLLAIQHKQFVENLVKEEEEVPVETKDDKKEHPEVRQMSPMSTLKTILGVSVTCLNNCYERVEVQLDEDSGDEEEQSKSVVFRPKDPYGHRPLPYVIGSKEFKEKWHVGLVDSESETDNEEDAQFSESGSESGQSMSLPSAGGSEADSVWGLQATSNALAHKSASQISSEDEQQNKVADSSFNPIPAQRAYFQPPKLTPRTNVPIDPAPSLFPESPPRVPGMSKNTGLFDDLEEDDFDAPAPKTEAKPPSFFRDQPDTRKALNLFDDEPPEFEPPPPVPKPLKQDGLFINSDSEEEFQVATPLQRNEMPSTAKRIEIPTNLFNEEPPVDTYVEKSDQEPITKPHVNLFDDNDDELDSFMNSLSSSKNKSVSAEEKSATNTNKPKLSNLFDDDEEPDDFLDTLLKGTRAKTKSQIANKRTDKPAAKDELPKEIKREEKMAEKPLSTNKKTSLFGDSDDDDIFSGSSKIHSQSVKIEDVPETKPQEEKKDHTKEFIKDTIPTKKDEIVYSNSINVEKPETPLSTTLHKEEEKSIYIHKTEDNSVEENDEKPEFKQHEKPPIPTPPTDLFDIPPDDGENQPPQKKSSLPGGLFDDFEDNEDFFIPNPQAQESQKSTNNVPLFDDLPPDDDLFVDRKVVSEVFYDDFADSFPPEITSVNPTGNSYLFSDEPPLDDWQEDKVIEKEEHSDKVISKKDTIHEDSEDTRSLKSSVLSRNSSIDEPDEIFSSVRNLIKSHEKSESTTEEISNKPKIVPNKLNKTMAINVAALLPGAKRPSFKTVQESPMPESPAYETELPKENTEENVAEATGIIKVKSVKVSGDSGSLLTNLNRDRAKIPQRRKPSTRMGRQEIYRKSLIVQEDENTENTQKILFDEKSDYLYGKEIEDPTEGKGEKELDLKKNPSHDLFGTETNDFLKQQMKDNKKGRSENKNPTKILPKASQSSSKNLFESDDEDDSDIFSTKKTTSVSKSISEPTKLKRDSLFGDSGSDDDDLFGSSSKSNSMKVSAPITKVDKKIVKKSVAGDDPLADLF